MSRSALSFLLTLLVMAHAWPAAAQPADGVPDWASDVVARMTAGGAGEPDLSYRVRRIARWRDGEAVHLDQLHRGVPVLGGDGVVFRSESGLEPVFRLQQVPGLTVGVTGGIGGERAVEIARAAVEGGAEMDVRAEVSVLPTPGGGRLVHRVQLGAVAPPAAWMVSVDALDGEVLDVSDLVRHALAYAYPENPVMTDLETVELTDLTGFESIMAGDYAQVWTVVYQGSDFGYEHLAIKDGDGNFFYEPEEGVNDDPFTEVNVYYHITQLSHHFEDVHGHEFPYPTTALTNYREWNNGTYDNAGYSPAPDGQHLLIFGQGDEVDFGYDGDVIAHEFGHAIVHDRTDLVHDELATYDRYGANIAPGGIDEGMADYWACTIHDNPVQGEYISDDPRDLDNSKTCPEDVVGESHGDGRIVGGTVWEIREALGSEAADALFYDALGLLSTTPSLEHYAHAIEDTARAMADDGELPAEQVDEVIDILMDRGMYRCGRAVDLHDGVPVTFGVGHLEGYGMDDLSDIICESFRDDAIRFDSRFQWAVTLPGADQGEVFSLQLAFDIERQDGDDLEDDDLHYTIYARQDEMVEFEVEEVETTYVAMPLPVPRPEKYDEAFGGTLPGLVITDESAEELRLSPGATYYFSMVHMNCPAVYVTVTPHIIVFEEPGEPEGGCRCSVEGSRSWTGVVALSALVIALGWVRRRR